MVRNDKSTKYVTISVAAFICYCNTLWGTFVFDDSEAIVKNKDVMPRTPLHTIFQNDFWGTNISLNSSHKSYRPLTILSYRLNVLYSNNKLDAFQFHATNVILYGLLCLLTVPVFELFLRKRKYQRNLDDVAYQSSLLFTIHPVHTESVAGLVGRADILCSILFLVVILLYHHVIKRRSALLFLLVLGAVAAAVLCKETAITVLAMCLAYDIFQGKKRKLTWLQVLIDSWFLIRNCTLLVAGLVILFYRFKVMNFEGPTFTSIDNPAAYSDNIFVRIFTYNYIYFLNGLLLIWPQWLCFDWSMGCIPLIDSYRDARLIIVLIFWLLALVSLKSIIKTILQNEVLDARVMGLSLIVLPFLPASNLFIKVGFVIAERTLLLPSAGFCFLIVIGLKKIENYAATNYKSIFVISFYVLCVIFAIRSIERNSNWLIEEKLFTSALDVCPLNAKVHYNVAKIAADRNDKQLALDEYKKAIELNPNYEQAMNNLANMLREDRLFDEAEILLRSAVKVRPNFAAAWMNLGIVLTNLNQPNEAEECYKMAIQHRNRYPDCYYNLGNLYLEMKRNRDALRAWEMAVLYRPTHIAAWSNSLVLLDSMRRFNEALDMGRQALRHNPKSASLHFGVASTLGKIKQFEQAERHFLEALSMTTNNPLYYSNLGVLYHRWGKVSKAREMYKKALELDPTMKTTRRNLKKITPTTAQ